MQHKQSAINQLRHYQTSAIIALGAVHLLNSDAVLWLRRKTVAIQRENIIYNPTQADAAETKYKVDLDIVVQEYRNHKERYMVSLTEFYKSARRALVKESFEVALKYAKATDQKTKLEATSWYWFAFAIRNAMSHDFKIDIKPNAKAHFPVTWEGLTIGEHLNGQLISDEILPWGAAFDLFLEMQKFVVDN